MIKVHIKLKDKRGFTVPLPYLLLRIGGAVASSQTLWGLVHKAVQNGAEENKKKFIPTAIDRKEVQKLLKAIQQYKGLTIVEVKDKDGTEVLIKL